MSADVLFTLASFMLALPLLAVIALALIVVWNMVNPFRRRW
jgi:hypothetical protein